MYFHYFAILGSCCLWTEMLMLLWLPGFAVVGSRSLAFLAAKDISLLLQGNVYDACVLLHESETWSLKRDNELALHWTEMRMIRWREIKGQTILHRIKAAVKNGKHSKVVQKNRVRRYGRRQERMMTGWKKCNIFKMYYFRGCEVRGRPRKTWKKVDSNDMTALHIQRSDAINGTVLNCGKWLEEIGVTAMVIVMVWAEYELYVSGASSARLILH